MAGFTDTGFQMGPKVRAGLEMHSESCDVIRRRWPGIWATIEQAPAIEVRHSQDTPEPTLTINGINLTSAYNQTKEAELQASRISKGSTVAWVYGFALGDIQRSLLKRNELTKIVVVIMNPSVVAASLCYFSHFDWLEDPRVELVLGSDLDEPVTPMAVAPACITLAANECAQLRDRIRLILGGSFQRKKSLERVAAATQSINLNRGRIYHDKDVATLVNVHPDSLVVCVAGGPTLTDQLEWMQIERNKIIIVTATTGILPLQSAGIIPDYVVAVDHHPYLENHVEGANTQALSTVPLVYSGEVCGGLLDRWPGPRYAFYLNQPRYKKIASDIPRGRLWCSGTVAHSAVDLSVRLGGKAIILAGYDFCYAKKQVHAKGSYDTRESQFLRAAHDRAVNGHGEQVPSTLNFVGYLRDLEDYIRLNPGVQFLNTGKDGAIIAGAPWLVDNT